MNTYESLREWTFWLGCWVVAVMIVDACLSVSPLGRDDSDEPGWFARRSGMRIMIDEKTGCQYFAAQRGGLTPRLDAHGKHLGCHT